MEISKKTLNASNRPGNLPGGDGAHDSVQVLEKARADTATVLKGLGPHLGGLSDGSRFSLEAGRDERDCPREASIGADALLTGEPYAEDVREGRRTFVNIKYTMMGTSSNFGNRFCMAGGARRGYGRCLI